MMNLRGESLSFKTLAHNVSDAVVMTDADGSIAWTNPAFRTLCGYSHKETLGRNLGQLLQGKNTDPATAKALRDAVHNGQYIQSKILNYHKNGHPYWVSISITPIKNDTGKLEGFVAIERDVTGSQLHAQALEKQVTQIYSSLLLSEAAARRPLAADDPFACEVNHDEPAPQ
jgi:PAS domain S-box-containing protein